MDEVLNAGKYIVKKFENNWKGIRTISLILSLLAVICAVLMLGVSGLSRSAAIISTFFVFCGAGFFYFLFFLIKPEYGVKKLKRKNRLNFYNTQDCILLSSFTTLFVLMYISDTHFMSISRSQEFLPKFYLILGGAGISAGATARIFSVRSLKRFGKSIKRSWKRLLD